MTMTLIAYYPGKVNVVTDALSMRPIVCVAILAAMRIQYKDQREDVAN